MGCSDGHRQLGRRSFRVDFPWCDPACRRSRYWCRPQASATNRYKGAGFVLEGKKKSRKRFNKCTLCLCQVWASEEKYAHVFESHDSERGGGQQASQAGNPLLESKGRHNALLLL